MGNADINVKNLKSIYDMFDLSDNMKGRLLQATPDYKMNLIDARHMTAEQINEFEGDLKAFLLMLQDRYDEERGEKRGAELVADLYQLLARDGKQGELDAALKDKKALLGLLKEYSLIED